MVEPLARPRGDAAARRAAHLVGRDRAAADRPLRGARAAAVDEVLYAEIARRRALTTRRSTERDDVFSALLLAEDEDGERLIRPRGPRRARDAAAGRPRDDRHRPRLVLRPAAAHAGRARAGARQRDERYLDAVVKEALRIRPVIPGVGRVVRGEPFRAERLRDPARGRDQPLDPPDPPPRGPLPGRPRVPARALPGRGPARHLHAGSRSAAAPAAAWARASR